MSNTLLSIDLSRSSSRVRFVFLNALAAGAFTSLTYWSLVNQDGLGANPTNVVAVFAVAGTGNTVAEVVVEPALAPGSLWNFTVTAVPNADASNTTATLSAKTGLPTVQLVNVEPQTNDLQLLLYSRDISHDGNDFQEDGTGDLLTVQGRANYLGAIIRRMTSYGLGWDPAYSPRADQYVNAPDALKLPLAGALVAQARADDRTKQATVTVVPFSPDATGNGWVFQMTIVGRDNLDPFTLQIPPTAVTA